MLNLSLSRAFLFLPAALLLAQSGCSAQTAHDEIFFSCSAAAPACPEKQACNLQDNCCHLIDEPSDTPLGHCKLGAGATGFPGSGAPKSGEKAASISTQ